jgi:hypothetical protein
MKSELMDFLQLFPYSHILFWEVVEENWKDCCHPLSLPWCLPYKYYTQKSKLISLSLKTGRMLLVCQSIALFHFIDELRYRYTEVMKTLEATLKITHYQVINTSTIFLLVLFQWLLKICTLVRTDKDWPMQTIPKSQ